MAALLGQLRRFPGVVRALRRGWQLGGRLGTELGPTGVARGRFRIYRGGVEGASGQIQWVPADVSPFRRHRSALAAPVCSLAFVLA
jgi:hypothetical protein